MPYMHSNPNPEYTADGRLQIGTLSINAATPAAGATVRVMQHGQPDDIIEELISDSSGRTPTINLPAPPIDFSMQPDSERQPYSEYDVSVSIEGHDQTYIKGVQILPDTTSYQDVNLRPVESYESGTDIIAIKDHTLWGDFPPKIPEMDTKPLPASTGLVVLPEPVVPEFVIVHAGRPDDKSAPNHWVPFRDYIKNVASSEIYANWPEQTIRANVLAILSFTLNRIYTEWYPSKGYDFTITNSTAFDHAFSFGRNIFEEISNVVDDIFTTFVTRPNIRQPLLTQYCDGKRVSCPSWMTQWGSKQLGDQGYAAIDILKRYYGYDIFLMQAKKVAGVPSSYSGIPLQMGSTGQDVRVVQEQLNAISNNFPAIKKVRVDGLFGEETRNSVETFQGVFRLPADGIVGFNTWYKLSEIFVAVTRMAELK